MKFHKKVGGKHLAKNINVAFQEQLTVGQKIADKMAKFGGSWPFIFSFTMVLFAWVFYQTIIASNKGFDPYPFILLNLVLSCLAAIQAPVIMMSQNRYAQKDRLQSDHDYQINLKAEKEIAHIQEELDSIRENQKEIIEKKLEEIKTLFKVTQRDN